MAGRGAKGINQFVHILSVIVSMVLLPRSCEDQPKHIQTEMSGQLKPESQDFGHLNCMGLHAVANVYRSLNMIFFLIVPLLCNIQELFY